MAAVALAARIALAVTLATAAVAKLVARDAVVVPVIEAVLAVALVVWPWSWRPAVLVIGLIAAFTVRVLLDLQRAVRPPCRCFGALSDRPVSGASVVRNGWLLALGIVALGARSGPSVAGVAVAAVVLAALTGAFLVRA